MAWQRAPSARGAPLCVLDVSDAWLGSAHLLQVLPLDMLQAWLGSAHLARVVHVCACSMCQTHGLSTRIYCKLATVELMSHIDIVSFWFEHIFATPALR